MLLSKGVEPIKVMKMGGWKDLETMMIYARKAGVDIRGATDCLNLNSAAEPSKVLHLMKL
jgi:integrase